MQLSWLKKPCTARSKVKMNANAAVASESKPINLSTEKEKLEAYSKCNVKIVPWRSTKKIILVRHGEGFHNVAGKKNYENYKSPQYEDAQLTPAGWNQATSLGRYIRRERIHVDLVVVSPMMRALQTAVGVFGIPTSILDQEALEQPLPLAVPNLQPEAGTVSSPSAFPSASSNASLASPASLRLLMPSQVEVPGRQATQCAFYAPSPPPETSTCQPEASVNSSLYGTFSRTPVRDASSSPLFISHELCREIIGLHPCDRRSPTSVYRKRFPGVDFSKVAAETDLHWRADERESREKIKRRGSAFLRWLMRRSEETIAVVSHASFLHHLIGGRYDEEDESVGDVARAALNLPFDNCEMRTVVISDTGDAALGGGPVPDRAAGSDDEDLNDPYIRMFMGWELEEVTKAMKAKEAGEREAGAEKGNGGGREGRGSLAAAAFGKMYFRGGQMHGLVNEGMNG